MSLLFDLVSKTEYLVYIINGRGEEVRHGFEGQGIITNSPRVLSHRLVTEQAITPDRFIGIMARCI